MVDQKESIPPILRPDKVVPVSLQAIADRFDLSWATQQSDTSLTGISMNTADLRPGDLFVAMPGLKTHGANFAQKAKDAGAVAIITDAAGKALVQGVGLATLLAEHPRSDLC